MPATMRISHEKTVASICTVFTQMAPGTILNISLLSILTLQLTTLPSIKITTSEVLPGRSTVTPQIYKRLMMEHRQ